MVDGSLGPKSIVRRREKKRAHGRILFVLFISALLLTALFLAQISGPNREYGHGTLYMVHAPPSEVRALTRGSGIVESYDSFVLVRMSEKDAAAFTARGIPVESVDYMERIGVANYPFYPGDKQRIPDYLRVEKSDYLLVKFHGPVKDEWRRALEKKGFDFLGYVPYNTFLVRGPYEEKSAVEKLPYVEYVGIYQPAYRIDPVLMGSSGMKEVKIILFSGVSPVKVAKEISALGGTVERWSYGMYNNYVVARMPPSVIYMASKIEGVLWIQPRIEFRVYNDVAHAILQDASTSASDHTVWDHGLHGEGQIIGESDTGIDYDHTMFRDSNAPKMDDPKNYDINNLPDPDYSHRKIVHYWTYVDDHDLDSSGHGTHVAGSIAGNATPYSSSDAQYNGEAPSAKLSFVDIGGSGDSLSLPDDLNIHFFWMYHDGARISSHSWGGSANGYTGEAMNVDQFMWSHPDYLVLFANGNAGSNTNTAGSPATAKDCISVGALGDDSSWSGSETLQDIAGFSSRGPTADGRLKPTIVSPGVAIDSADSDGDPTSNNGGITSMQGTSMATPNAAGAMALVRQYFTDGYYPTGSKGTGYAFTPSNALLKAMAINSADQATGNGAADHPYNGMTFPNNDQGFGRLHLENVLYFPGDSRKLLVYDHGFDGSRGIVTGETWERKVVVSSSSEDLKITLVWTDYPGIPGASTALVNDLDLVAIAPDGTEYHGNIFSGSTIGSVYSSANPSSYDRVNPEEEIWVNSPATGTWTIRVVGYSVAVAQPFALVITGDLDTSSSIDLDKNVYSENDVITIRVVDTASSGTVTAHISSTTDSSGLDVTLTETAAGSHVFVGTVQTSPTSAAGKLAVSDGDEIIATYGQSSANAHVDASAPSLNNLHVEDVADNQAYVVWDTDDYTNYTLRFGDNQASLSSVIRDTNFTYGTHRVLLYNLTPNTTYYVDVSAWDRVGHMVSGSLSFTTLPRGDVLIVDDDSPSSNWEEYIMNSLSANGWTYGVWHYAAQGRPTLAYVQQYRVVVWDTADGYPPIDDDDVTQVLEPYLDNGGRLFIIGQDIGWAAYDTQNSPWASTTVQGFIENYLGSGFNNDDSGGRHVTGVSGDPVGDGISDSLVDTIGGLYPEDLKAQNGGVTFLQYDDASNKIAGVRHDATTYRTVYLGLAFQDISTEAQRNLLMDQAIVWLLGSNQHPSAQVTYPNGGETVSGVVTITWTASDDSAVDHAEVYYSDDGGNTWYYIGKSTGNSIDWDTTSVNDGNNYLVRVIVYDDTGLHVIDSSDSTFTVSNAIPEFSDGILAVLLVVLVLFAALRTRRD